MNFEPGGIYHIYNQGNNRQKIFYNRKNYLFFLRKIKSHIRPYGNILAWCLMPNHFHLMLEVERISVAEVETTLNDSIGIILRSYTRAINIQENRTGSLFRKQTKAICLNANKGISSSWYTSLGVTGIKVYMPESQYLRICFNYIHANPVNAGLVEKAEDWEFSSCSDLKGLRKGNLVYRNRVKELGLLG